METDNEKSFAQLFEEGKVDVNPVNKDLKQYAVPSDLFSDVAMSVTSDLDSWKASGVTEKRLRNLGKTKSHAQYDYHGQTVEQAYAQLENDLQNAFEHGHEVIEIVHGIGQEILKIHMRGWLRACNWVLAFVQPTHNEGCVIVLLRSANHT